MEKSNNTKICPQCHRSVDDFEMYCNCGYEFGSNKCSNPKCKYLCGDFTVFCPICGSETNNYLNGDIGIAVPTNVT